MTIVVETKDVDTEPVARSVGGQILRAPIDKRTWREAGYLVISSMLGALGAAYLFLGFVFGATLAVVLIGIPLLAAVVVGSRAWAAAFRQLSEQLLHTRVAAPRAFEWRGAVGTLAAALSDRTGWRAALFIAIQSVLSVVGVFGALLFAALAIAFAVSPVIRLVADPINVDADGNVRHSFVNVGNIYFDTWPQLVLLSVIGVVGIFLAPWPIRLLVMVERFLVISLLGESDYDARVSELESTRAVAVDASTATLRRVERDLHDGTQARLVTMAMALGRAEDKLAKGEDVTDLISTAHGTAKDALVELREVVRGIHPPALDLGLGPALETLAARSSIPVLLSIRLPDRPTRSVESIAYFSVAELVTNVVKHAHASTAWVSVDAESNRIVVVVRDNGVGGATVGGGTGLTGLAARASTVDGTLTVESPSGGPTAVTLVLPVAAKGARR